MSDRVSRGGLSRSKRSKIAPLLQEAKRQLVEEANDKREGEQMALSGRLLADTRQFVVPRLDAELTPPCL